MEQTQQIAKPTQSLFPFPPVRPRHLNSATYNSFLHILSHCFNSQSISPQSQPGGCVNVEAEQAYEKEFVKGSDVVSNAKSTELERLSYRDNDKSVVNEGIGGFDSREGDFDETRAMINELMSIEENEDSLRCKDNGSGEDIGVQGDGMGEEQRVVLEELEQLINSSASEDRNQNDSVVLENRESFGSGQIEMEKIGEANPLLVDKRNCNQKACEAVNSVLDKSDTGEVADCDGEGDMLNSNEVDNNRPQKKIKVDSSACISSALSSFDHLIGDGGIEEGEFPGDSTVNDQSVNKLSIESLALEEKKHGNQSSDGNDINDKRDSVSTLPVTETGVCATNVRVEVNQKLTGEVANQLGLSVQGSADFNYSVDADERKDKKVAKANEKVGSSSTCRGTVFYGDIVEENATGNHDIRSTKEDVGASNKKKRGTPTEQRKTKKKEKKRKKRAKKNRELGVKRLKLPPVTKPKTITYCRHFLKGRCHEGDKCKFSHDTVPLTKSKACCHFARHSCMKGDDCPFDHQLSKYPCNNFVSTGSCSRGDSCMFSHKIIPKDDSATNSNVGDPQLKPLSIPNNSNSKQLIVSSISNHSFKALSHSKGTPSCKNIEEKIAAIPLRPPGLASQETCSLSRGNPLLVDSSRLQQAVSSLNKNNDAKIRNQMGESASGAVQNLNSTPKNMNMASRGINFLSFGKTSSENISGRKLDNFPLSKNIDIQNQPESIRVVNLSSPSSSNRNEDSNEKLKISRAAFSPLGINFHSFGKGLSDHNAATKPAIRSPSCRTDVERSSQEPSSSSKAQDFNSFPWGLSGSPLLSAQPSDTTPGHTKSTPNSTQKSLLSTLAFATKLESQLKMKGSIGSLVGGATGKSTSSEVPRNDST